MTNKGAAAAAAAGPPLLLGLLGVLLLASLPTTVKSSTPTESVAVYNVTTKLIDDSKELTFTIKLKARQGNNGTVHCSLYDPKSETIYQKKPCGDNSSFCDDDDDQKTLTVDNSYVGNFEIKFNGAFVEWLTVSSGSSLKQLSFYRIIANHLFFGVDVLGKNEGTFPMIEESVYGKCEALVKIVRKFHGNGDKPHVDKAASGQMISIKTTRNLESCHPMPGLLVFGDFFYHPMMSSVHYDIKSSISRFIVSPNTFTSYTTEDIAVKELKDGAAGGNTTMLHVRTTVTLDSIGPSTGPYPRIIDPIRVQLPFIDGFDPTRRVTKLRTSTASPTTPI